MKKLFFTLFAVCGMFMLTSCGGAEGDVIDAYEEAQAKMEKASSDDEIDEINDELIDKIGSIIQENPDEASKLSTSADVKKAYKEYWDAVENTEGTHWMFVSMPTIKNIKKKLKE